VVDLVTSGPTIDPVFRSPTVKKVRPTSYVYSAQVNLGSKDQDKKARTETGDRPRTRGHLVFRTRDLAPNTTLPKPKKGWQVKTLFVGTDQEQAVDWLIEEVRIESPLRGRPLLVYCELEMDRDRGHS
jgi:hypothetical protein